MIGAKHFRTLIESDEQGPIVTVTHLPTNQTRTARPGVGESCYKVRWILERQIIATFYNERDLDCKLMLTRENGKSRDHCHVTHLPTQRTAQFPGTHFAKVIDALLLELWQEGLLLLRAGTNNGSSTHDRR